ncbi:hypothetical protein ACFXTO_029783 [Malus domestica]
MDHYLAFSTLKLRITTSFAPSRPAVQLQTVNRFFRLLTFVARAGVSHYEFSSLNSPLDLQNRPGKDLCTVLQNHPQLFHLAVTQELKKLADDRELALSLVEDECSSIQKRGKGVVAHRLAGYGLTHRTQCHKNSFNHPARNNNENSNHHGRNDNVLRLGLPALPAAKRLPPPQSSTVFTCTTTSASGAADECAICFDDFVDRQVCRLLGNCQHSFHRLCIDQWLPTGETYCPVCRAPV